MADNRSPTQRRARARQPAVRLKHVQRPEVILDFVFDDGLLFVAIENIGDEPAFKVSVKFDKPIVGVAGRDITRLPLFQCIEFLAPHKTIKTFLDSSAAYFQRGEPTHITATVTYRAANRKRYTTSIYHDLGIYADICYIQRPSSRSGVDN